MPKASRITFLGSDGLLIVLVVCASLAASRTLLQQLVASVNFTLDSDLFCWYKWKNWFLWFMAAVQAGKNLGGLTQYLWWGMYTSIPNWTHPQNSLAAAKALEFKDILPWNIFEMIMKTAPISTSIVTSYAVNWGISFWVCWKVNGNWDNCMIRISQWRESHCRTSTSFRRKE